MNIILILATFATDTIVGLVVSLGAIAGFGIIAWLSWEAIGGLWEAIVPPDLNVKKCQKVTEFKLHGDKAMMRYSPRGYVAFKKGGGNDVAISSNDRSYLEEVGVINSDFAIYIPNYPLGPKKAVLDFDGKSYILDDTEYNASVECVYLYTIRDGKIRALPQEVGKSLQGHLEKLTAAFCEWSNTEWSTITDKDLIVTPITGVTITSRPN